MNIETIKYLNLYNQFLIEKGEKKDVVKCLCGLQAQFLSNAYHALRIRCNETLDEKTWGNGLVKTWANRATVHVITIEDIGLYRRQLNKEEIDKWDSNWKISAERKKKFADLILDCLKDGIGVREELKEKCFEAGMTKLESEAFFDQWGGVLREMADKGLICYKVTEKKEFMLTPSFISYKPGESRIETAYRYFRYYGPATIKDAAYFFGTTQKEIKSLLPLLPVKQYQCNGRDYFYIGDELKLNMNIPKCIFLAGFDPLMMGYQKKENLFLPPEFLRGIFNLAGIVMPAVLYEGNVIGKWKKIKNKIRITVFRNITSYESLNIEESALKLWGDSTKVEFMHF